MITLIMAGGGFYLLIYKALKHLILKWLDSEFEKRLYLLKHEQQKEIENLRYKISALLDRTAKLHQHEFDVLPEIWIRLNDAYSHIRSSVFPLQTYPDIENMSPNQQEAFINECSLQEWQKEELRTIAKKNNYYQYAITWHDINQASKKTEEAYAYLIKHSIFINADLQQKLLMLHGIYSDALMEYKNNEKNAIFPRKMDKIDRLINEGEQAIILVEKTIHAQLWSSNNKL